MCESFKRRGAATVSKPREEWPFPQIRVGPGLQTRTLKTKLRIVSESLILFRIDTTDVDIETRPGLETRTHTNLKV